MSHFMPLTICSHYPCLLGQSFPLRLTLFNTFPPGSLFYWLHLNHSDTCFIYTKDELTTLKLLFTKVPLCGVAVIDAMFLWPAI
jgi:hypothetical protein